jgi:hypothetical protein
MSWLFVAEFDILLWRVSIAAGYAFLDDVGIFFSKCGMKWHVGTTCRRCEH